MSGSAVDRSRSRGGADAGVSPRRARLGRLLERLCRRPRGRGRLRLERLHGAGTDATFQGWTDVWLRPEFRSWDLRDVLPSVACPVLLVQGEDDQFGTLRQIEAIEARAGGPIARVLLPGCGHSPHHQRREETLAAMAGFLRRHLA